MNAISETEHARLAQWFINEPSERMGVLGFPASGQRTWPACNPSTQGTDSRLCGAKTPACGGKHADEITSTGIEMKGNALVNDPALPRAKGLAIGSACFS
jgi:hypothetical protein